MTTSVELLPTISPYFLWALLAVVFAVYAAVRLATGPANYLAKNMGILALRGALVALLLALLTNPVRVTELPNTFRPPEVFFVLDASESMAMENGEATRWEQAADLIRHSTRSATDGAVARVSLFQFGRRLRAIGDPAALGLESNHAAGGGVTFVKKDEQASGSGRGDRRASLGPERTGHAVAGCIAANL